MDKKLKVLIVDDSLLAEHAIKSYFTKLGHEVVGLAKNGMIAKLMIEEHNPELVTVDAIMPVLPGLDVVKYINERDKETGDNTRIFMISANIIPEKDKTNINVDAFILKPITLKKITKAIQLL